jgi:hypothetical protein
MFLEFLEQLWNRIALPVPGRLLTIRLGVPLQQAYQWSRSRMGGWAIAQSPILGTTITIERLSKRGHESLLTYYGKVAPHLNEPLYTRPVRTVV